MSRIGPVLAVEALKLAAMPFGVYADPGALSPRNMRSLSIYLNFT
jgi:hypothetical protein